VDINSATLIKRGISEDKLWALEDWRTSNLFDERERVTLEYAEAITRSDLEVSDDLMARLKQQFDGDAIVELTALIASRTCRANSTPRSTCPRRVSSGCRHAPRRDSLLPEAPRSSRGSTGKQARCARAVPSALLPCALSRPRLATGVYPPRRH
jgi:hypothetical protein